MLIKFFVMTAMLAAYLTFAQTSIFPPTDTNKATASVIADEKPIEKNDGTILQDFFENHEHRLIHKWVHYFEIYEQHLSKFRNQPITMVEFGVFHGGSLQMWKYYFGEKAKIIGFDINPLCKDLEEENITVVIGDQEDPVSLNQIRAIEPKLDIIIDDGGHTMNQQRVTFEEMWASLKEGGIYICEDLHTSYWAEYGGGYKNPVSFIEYSKNLIDQLNAWHSRDAALYPNDFSHSAHGIHFYDSVVVIEKRTKQPHQSIKRGTPSY